MLLGTSHATGDQVAVKRIRKDKLTDEVERHDLELEVDVMNRIGVGSLNCIWLLDTFEDSRYVCMRHVREVHTRAYSLRPSWVQKNRGRAGVERYESEVSSRSIRRISATCGWWCWTS